MRNTILASLLVASACTQERAATQVRLNLENLHQHAAQSTLVLKRVELRTSSRPCSMRDGVRLSRIFRIRTDAISANGKYGKYVKA